MKEKVKSKIIVEKAKYLDMRDFAEMLMINKGQIVPHKGGFFLDYNVFRSPTQKSDNMFVGVTNICYSPGDFKRYIILDTKFKHSLEDEPSLSSCAFFAKVLKFEDYELSAIDQRILEAVKKNEEFRKSS